MTDELIDVWAEQRQESEQRLVACVTMDPDRLAAVSQIVSPSDFVNDLFASWYAAALDLFDSGKFTVDRLRSQLRKAGKLRDAADLQLFAELTRGHHNTHDAEFHASEVARISAATKLKAMLTSTLSIVDDVAIDPDQVIERLMARLESITTREAELWESVTDVAERVYEAHKANYEADETLGTPTGFPSIDRITGGFFPGQLWHIAARSYMGKSTVALSFAQQQIDAGRGVYFASYEMENDELMERMFSDRTGTPLSKFTQGGIVSLELQRVAAAVSDFRGKTLHMDDKPPGSVSQLRARVKLANTHGRVVLVVIDHLLLFPHHDRRTPRHQQLVEITRDLKAMAKELGVTILLLNQLNADADGEKPTDKHYSESKGIIANLDVSILLHRDTKTSEDLECNITKNRKGRPDSCTLRFEGEIQRVTDTGNTWQG